MSTRSTAPANNKVRLQETFEAAGKVASVAFDADMLKKRVENAVEDALDDAQRMARRGRNAVEDAIDDTAHLIKKNPWESVGYVLAAGFGIGFFAGWLVTRQNGNK